MINIYAIYRDNSETKRHADEIIDYQVAANEAAATAQSSYNTPIYAVPVNVGGKQ